MFHFRALIIAAFAFSGCVKREFNTSAAKSRSAGVWGTASCLSGGKAIQENGRFLTVYTYTTESDFQQVLGQGPSVLKPQEWSSLANAFLQKKMETAVESNLKVKSFQEFGQNARVGYGVYVATDPMQSPEYGEYLIAFDVPTDAPYVHAAEVPSLNMVQCPFFGVIYKYAKSVSGEKAAALRFDRSTHPQGIPFVADSIRVYRRSWTSTTTQSLKFLSGPADHKIYGITWAEINAPAADASVMPEKSFLDSYFHYLEFYSQLRTTKSLFSGPTLNADNTLTPLGVLYALKAELTSRPKWIVEGLERHRNSLPGSKLSMNYCSRHTTDTLSFDSCMFYQFFRTLQHGLESSRSLGLDLEEATLFAQNLNLLRLNAEPTNYAVLVRDVLEQWKSEERMNAINKGIQSYNRALNYWKAENLDAFVNRKSP